MNGFKNLAKSGEMLLESNCEKLTNSRLPRSKEFYLFAYEPLTRGFVISCICHQIYLQKLHYLIGTGFL